MEETEKLLTTLNEAAECTSLLKKNCTPEIQDKLKKYMTKLGGTLGDCVKSGNSSQLFLFKQN